MEAGKESVDKVSPRDKKNISEAFKKLGLDGNGRFESVGQGLAAVTKALSELGFNLDMVNADQIRGDQGSVALPFRRSNDEGQDPFTEKDGIKNSRVAFSWTNLVGGSDQLAPKKFECLAYPS